MLKWDKRWKPFLSAGVVTPRLTFREVLMLVNMVLFIILGAAMLIRAPLKNASFLAYLMGCGFLFAGGYRLYLVYKTSVGPKGGSEWADPVGHDDACGRGGNTGVVMSETREAPK